MFKLECFIDDKQLAKAMHGLDGLVLDLKVLPVKNAVKKNGKLKSTASGSTMEAIAGYIASNNLTETITTKQIHEALKASGFSVGGVTNAIVNAVKAKIIKKGKERGQYVILNRQEA
jgi:hypothetical protein